MTDRTRPKTYRFGEFTLVAGAGELYRNDRRVPLRPQAAAVLERLLQTPDALVSRRELQQLLWVDTNVDAEAGLNHCVRQVRRALGDRAGEPRFVATEPRRGYRFVAPVDIARSIGVWRRVTRAAEVARAALPPVAPPPVAPPLRTPSPISPEAAALVAGFALVLIVAGASYLPFASLPSAPAPALPEPTEPPEAQPAPTGPAATLPKGPADTIPEHVTADFQRARYLLRQPGPEPAGRAVALLERVTTAAPEFAAGHAALARALLQAAPGSPAARARRHVERALQLAPTLAEALVVRGDVRSLVDRDWGAAELDYRRAQRAEPLLTEPLHHLAGMLAALGRHREAIDLMHQALEIDAVSPLLAGDLAWFYFVARDWESARAWARRTLDLEPGWSFARSVWLHASVRLGREAEVRELAAETLRKAGADTPVIERVRTAIDPLAPYWSWWDEELAGAGDAASRVYRAWAHAALDRPGAALDDLEAAEAAGYLFLTLMVRDPRLDGVRSTPRFAALLDRLGLPHVAAPPKDPIAGAGSFRRQNVAQRIDDLGQ